MQSHAKRVRVREIIKNIKKACSLMRIRVLVKIKTILYWIIVYGTYIYCKNEHSKP